MTATRATLVGDLRQLGVSDGDHVALGISFKSVGPVEGGPATVLDALIEAVGPRGTIVSPTFTIPSFVPRDYIFDADATPAYTGLLPEMLRTHGQAWRSRHPTSSVAALGRLASHLTEDHGANASEYLPYARLAEAGGKVLSIGIGDRLVSFWHEAQSRAGLLDRVPCSQQIKYRTTPGDVKVYRRKRRAGCTKTLSRMLPMMRSQGMVSDGMVGEAESILVPASASLSYMSETLRNTPEVNLCSELTCLWCRHLERSMSLQARVAAPRYFQSNAMASTLVAAINQVRLLDLRALVRLEVAIGKFLRGRK